MPAHCAADKPGFASSINATTPATYGLAMLVPDIEIQGSSGSEKPFAATTLVPGAAISGLYRPSRVGPWLLLALTLWLWSSRFDTAMMRCPHARELMEWESVLLSSEKKEGNLYSRRLPTGSSSPGSSRSIQALNRPSRTSSPVRRTFHTPASMPRKAPGSRFGERYTAM